MITCVCYDKPHQFETIEDAQRFYLNCFYGSEGSEQSRYAMILAQLMEGKTYCTDEY